MYSFSMFSGKKLVVAGFSALALVAAGVTLYVRSNGGTGSTQDSVSVETTTGDTPVTETTESLPSPATSSVGSTSPTEDSLDGSTPTAPGQSNLPVLFAKSDPAYKEKRTSAPTVATLEFEKIPDSAKLQARLYDADSDADLGEGIPVSGESSSTLQSPTIMQFKLPVHGSGSYYVEWKAVLEDGRIVSGKIPYTVA